MEKKRTKRNKTNRKTKSKELVGYYIKYSGKVIKLYEKRLRS